jgi:hypothetical protein
MINYCTIEDAWGNNNYISDKYTEYMTNSNVVEKLSDPVESNEPIPPINYESNIEINCSNFWNHINSCEKCQDRLREQYTPKLLQSFKKIIDNNNDIIVLILVGISILLFFHLINNLTK